MDLRTWERWLARDDVLLIDTETTGLSGRDEIIEVAIIDTLGERQFHSLVLPRQPISSGAYRVHGLTTQFLASEGAPTWSQIHADLVAVLESASLILGWNVGFDQRMFLQTARRYRKRVPLALRNDWHDLIPAYRRVRPGGRHRLEDAVRREGVRAHDAHRALGDCYTVLDVMLAAVESD